jgi:hypothetical protein
MPLMSDIIMQLDHFVTLHYSNYIQSICCICRGGTLLMIATNYVKCIWYLCTNSPPQLTTWGKYIGHLITETFQVNKDNHSKSIFLHRPTNIPLHRFLYLYIGGQTLINKAHKKAVHTGETIQSVFSYKVYIF